MLPISMQEKISILVISSDYLLLIKDPKIVEGLCWRDYFQPEQDAKYDTHTW